MKEKEYLYVKPNKRSTFVSEKRLQSPLRLLMLNAKYWFILTIFGVIFLYIALDQGGWYLLLAWIALNILALALGYALFGPKIFQKDSKGTIPFWSKVLYFPYYLFCFLNWNLTRFLNKENPYDKASKDLFLGRRLLPSEVPKEIDNYIDLTAEFEENRKIRQSINYISLPILDGHVPSRKDLQKTLSRLSQGVTLVHCAVGHGRAALFTLILLAEKGKIKNFEEGLQLLSKVRPRYRLSRAQQMFLKEYLQTIPRSNPGDSLKETKKQKGLS